MTKPPFLFKRRMLRQFLVLSRSYPFILWYSSDKNYIKTLSKPSWRREAEQLQQQVLHFIADINEKNFF